MWRGRGAAVAQVPTILGAAAPPGVHFMYAALQLLLSPERWAWGPIAVAATTAVCLKGGSARFGPLFPGAVLAVALGCCATAVGLPVGPTVGAVAGRLPVLLDLAALPWASAAALAAPAFVIAAASFAESAAISKRFSDEARERTWLLTFLTF
jgi:MFS superfamily sulfate permease-like transporter